MVGVGAGGQMWVGCWGKEGKVAGSGGAGGDDRELDGAGVVGVR